MARQIRQLADLRRYSAREAITFKVKSHNVVVIVAVRQITLARDAIPAVRAWAQRHPVAFGVPRKRSTGVPVQRLEGIPNDDIRRGKDRGVQGRRQRRHW